MNESLKGTGQRLNEGLREERVEKKESGGELAESEKISNPSSGIIYQGVRA